MDSRLAQFLGHELRLATLEDAAPSGYSTAKAATDDDTETIVLSVACAEDSVTSVSVRWIGHRPADDVVLIREATLAFKRVAAGTVSELGAHDNGNVRDVEGDADWATDYAANAGAIDVSVTGEVGSDINWLVEAWARSLPFAGLVP